jgi:hypothetical protein
LLECGGGPVLLTPAGEAFLESATQMVRSLDGSREEMRSVAGRHTGADDAARLLPGWQQPDAPRQWALEVTGPVVARSENFRFAEPYTRPGSDRARRHRDRLEREQAGADPV